MTLYDQQSAETLYARLGGYDAICAVANDLLPRLMGDEQLGRFWRHRGADGLRREKQLLIDFLASSAGGPVYYTGRYMLTTHRGMGITANDWSRFLDHLNQTLDRFEVGPRERDDVLTFIDSMRSEIIDA
jgi:hemoglobin